MSHFLLLFLNLFAHDAQFAFLKLVIKGLKHNFPNYTIRMRIKNKIFTFINYWKIPVNNAYHKQVKIIINKQIGFILINYANFDFYEYN